MGVTNVGINHALGVVFNAQSASTTWYIGLINGSATLAAADTMASHSGWTEDTDYSESNRVTWPEDAAASQSITNTTTADFSISSDGTLAGVFLVDDNTKAGTTGTLFATAAFSGGDQSVSNGDTLKITFTINGSNV